MTFRVNQSPQSRVMIVLCFAKFQIRKSHWIDGFLKYLNRFFFQKPRKSKNALYYQKNLQFLFEIDQKVSIFVEKLKKMQPPKMNFRSQLEPSIKSYECFMFLLHFRLEMTWTDGFLKDLNSFFFFSFHKPRKSKNALDYQKNLQFIC